MQINLSDEALETLMDAVDVALGRAPEHLADREATGELYDYLLALAGEQNTQFDAEHEAERKDDEEHPPKGERAT